MVHPGQINFHRRLLNDSDRMSRYRDAIFATVRARDVVLDVGSGSGILALFACQAGAGHVHCVEREAIIKVAAELAQANGFADRISFHPCDAADLVLEGGVDVIQSELIGKSGIGQMMAETIGTCRDRFLRPGGRILPARVRILAAPVECQETDRRARLPATSAYGIDFSPYTARARHTPLSARIPARALIAPGAIFYEYVAATAPLTDLFDARLEFPVDAARTLTGLTVWFEAELAEGIRLGNPPPGIGSWDNHYFPMSEPVPLCPGDVIDLRIAGRDERSMAELWRWDTTVRRAGAVVAAFRQSTFLADIPPPAQVASPA